MTAPIGFALLSYHSEPQIVRLATRLRDLYGAEARIALHHNFDQGALDPAKLPPSVQIVRPHLATGWGTWSTVEAELRALDLLHAGGDGPEFTVLLSEADYPAARPEHVLGELRAGGADAYIRALPVDPWRRDPVAPGPLGLAVNEGGENQQVCYRRYYPTTLRPFGLRFRIRHPLVAPLLSPFQGGFRCYAGEGWWTLGRRAVTHLLASRARRPDLVRWFAARHIPEEGFVHTVIGNSPGLRVDRHSRRYIDWSSRAPSPRLLGVGDVPAIAASGAHFARKFAPDDPALDALDAALGLAPWRAVRSA
jgi:hypothetical protein